LLSEVRVRRDCLKTLLAIARAAHPRETILLLRGSIKSGIALIYEVLMPPISYTSNSCIAFNPFRLPIDFSIIGVAHSHPSGSLKPSTRDLLSKYKLFLMIIRYPYESEMDIAVYTYDGRRLKLRVVN